MGTLTEPGTESDVGFAVDRASTLRCFYGCAAVVAANRTRTQAEGPIA